MLVRPGLRELQPRHSSVQQSEGSGEDDVVLLGDEGQGNQAGLFHVYGADNRIRQGK